MHLPNEIEHHKMENRSLLYTADSKRPSPIIRTRTTTRQARQYLVFSINICTCTFGKRILNIIFNEYDKRLLLSKSRILHGAYRR